MNTQLNTHSSTKVLNQEVDRTAQTTLDDSKTCNGPDHIDK